MVEMVLVAAKRYSPGNARTWRVPLRKMSYLAGLLVLLRHLPAVAALDETPFDDLFVSAGQRYGDVEFEIAYISGFTLRG